MKKIKIMLVLFTSLILPFVSFSQEVKTDASVDFKIKNFGLNVDGFFGNVSITHNFKSENPKDWSLEGIIKVNSVKTGIEKRDKHLLEEDYFDANTYPEIKLLVTNFRKVSESKHELTAELTIKATTKTIKFPLEFNDTGSRKTLQAYFEINRRDYGVGGSSFSMSNTAKITVNYTLIK